MPIIEAEAVAVFRRLWRNSRLACAAALIVPVFLAAPVFADTLSVCHRFGCKAQTPFTVSAEEDGDLRRILSAAADAGEERRQMGVALQYLYITAGRQTPVYADKGGNFRDGTTPGRMDCVDHSENITTFLNYLQRKGMLRYHTAGMPVYRNPRFFDLHYAGSFTDRQGNKWVADSWFYDFGHLPVVYPYDEWKAGKSPPPQPAE